MKNQKEKPKGNYNIFWCKIHKINYFVAVGKEIECPKCKEEQNEKPRKKVNAIRING